MAAVYRGMIIWDSKRDSRQPTGAQYLTLRRNGSCWIVDWSHTARANEIRALFGTAMVPTAYTFMAEAVDVYNAIKAANPEYLIYVA